VRGLQRSLCYTSIMANNNQVRELFDRVRGWPIEDQEKLVRFADEIERGNADDDITDEEWNVISQRAARRDLAPEDEVQEVFTRYRHA
jgi:hypothetical protein